MTAWVPHGSMVHGIPTGMPVSHSARQNDAHKHPRFCHQCPDRQGRRSIRSVDLLQCTHIISQVFLGGRPAQHALWPCEPSSGELPCISFVRISFVVQGWGCWSFFRFASVVPYKLLDCGWSFDSHWNRTSRIVLTRSPWFRCHLLIRARPF